MTMPKSVCRERDKNSLKFRGGIFEMNNNLHIAFEETAVERVINNVPQAPDHTFSKKFERKMIKLIKQGYSEPAKHHKITPKRLFVCITAALIAAVIMIFSVGAVWNFFRNFFVQIFETHTDVQSVATDNAPLDFSDIYEITADMSDYELILCSEDSSDRTYIYQNNNCKIYFTQSIKEYYDISVNTEGYDMETISVKGHEGFYVDMYNHYSKIVNWDNGDYILFIYVTYDTEYNFSKDELITLAESVQKVER